MNTEQKAREWLAKPNQLDTRMMIASLENAEEIITALLAERQALMDATKKTIADNLHLADGEYCTLYDLKQAIAMCEESK